MGGFRNSLACLWCQFISSSIPEAWTVGFPSSPLPVSSGGNIFVSFTLPDMAPPAYIETSLLSISR